MLDTATIGGQYHVQRLVGRGGMSEVYLAEDERLGRLVALKVLRSALVDDDRSVRRIREEARRAASLTHPNIVVVHDTGEHDGAPYIVMEYVEGRSLADLVADGPLDPSRAVEITASICRALQAAHQRGIVHADVKPANVLLTDDGAVKVTDFGIARALGDDLTQTSVLGTAAYVSPEQARGEPLDVRSDLYSLGAVLYEMLVGRPPFVGDSVVEVVQKHAREQPQRPSDLRPEVPSALDAVVLHALSKDPEARYDDAGDMLEDLDRATRGLSTTTAVMPAVSLEEEVAEAEEERARPRRWPIVLLGALLLLGGALVLATTAPWDVAEVEVPDLDGMTIEEARAELADRDLRIGEVTEVSAEAPPLTVVGQHPPEGAVLEPGDAVDLTISVGPDEEDEEDDGEGDAEGDGSDEGEPTQGGQQPEQDGGGQQPPPGQQDGGGGNGGDGGPPHDQPPGHGGEPPGQQGKDG